MEQKLWCLCPCFYASNNKSYNVILSGALHDACWWQCFDLIKWNHLIPLWLPWQQNVQQQCMFFPEIAATEKQNSFFFWIYKKLTDQCQRQAKMTTLFISLFIFISNSKPKHHTNLSKSISIAYPWCENISGVSTKTKLSELNKMLETIAKVPRLIFLKKLWSDKSWSCLGYIMYRELPWWNKGNTSLTTYLVHSCNLNL